MQYNKLTIRGCDSLYIVLLLFFSDDVQAVTARIGSSNKYDGGKEYGGDFTLHENYNTDTLDYDIAYFKSHRAMTLDGVRAKAIALIEEGTSIPSWTMLKISGWGDTRASPTQIKRICCRG